MDERKVVLISGANRGIGEAVGRHLAEQGWQLSLGMRMPREAAWHERDGIQVVRYDANEAGSEAAWVDQALKRFGRIDAVIANAGLMIPKTVIEASDEELDSLLEINVKAPRRLVAAAWEALGVSGQGRVILMASLSGKRVKSAASGLYAMTKFAAVALTHGIRQAGWEQGIRATAICPSFVATDMARSITTRNDAEMTHPADIARLVGALLELPNEASVAELTINCQLEESY
ncbi:NADP-dependent 3-hydroxy acid dehydrogenase YdfG [Pseudomonas duriflava]|uniref:NADP-dependent 3-hydroxy acid dehydrogenase YdfG n=1 Tax=Pseudomonas duriflava TaxID=459528 RepID=A0A562QAC2_9PSED|nr:SDR family NAD(P)-dependent oxidoreductase [Pseudomonas duriflava]TWI53711.1 NADP-dependent 3-hydroxy acid dehydrogenase YdfG [Pseudomonas duriflava]